MDIYKPDKLIEELSREKKGKADIIKLSSNENSLGPSKKVLREIRKCHQNISYYPDNACFELKKCLSDCLNIKPEQLTIGNGSVEILSLLGDALLNSSVSAIFSQYAFIEYKNITRKAGATGVVIPSRNWGHDLFAMLKAINKKTRIIFIANPNNPTGTLLRYNEIKEFLKKVPSYVIVVVDEAYHEYVTDPDYKTALDLLDHFNNLVILRTFSKAYGLAGLRIGYSVSNVEVAAILNQTRIPFNINYTAQKAAIVALNDNEYIKKTITFNEAGKRQLQTGFDKINISYIPSFANFITIQIGGGATIFYEKLLEFGIIVRPLDLYNLPDHLRITIGLPKENKKLLDVLEFIMRSDLSLRKDTCT